MNGMQFEFRSSRIEFFCILRKAVRHRMRQPRSNDFIAVDIDITKDTERAQIINTIHPHEHYQIGDIGVVPIRVMHDQMPILGYRFGKFAYITDMKSMGEEEYAYLDGVETLVINALRFEKTHHSHQLVADAIEASRKIGAKHTYFIHVTHQIGFHDEANKRLPEGFEFGFDQMEIFVDNK